MINFFIINKGVNGDTSPGMLFRSFNDSIEDFNSLFIVGIHPTKQGHKIMAGIINF